MTGVAAAIVQRWFEVPELVALVPAGQLIIGPPAEGWALPGVAITRYARVRGERTSGQTIDLLEVTWALEADRAEVLDEITEAIITRLPQFAIGTRTVVNWRDYNLTIERDAESEHFRGELTTTFHVW